MTARGLQTEIHITVADDRAAIREALPYLEKRSDFIFVTGGLGPTSDDFTRELIQEWTGLPMEFHEASWQKIQKRLSTRGLPVADFQKQQCLFPKGSEVLENSLGTANAFYLRKGTKHVWVLPGPPNEIAAVWQDHIDSRLDDLTQGFDPYVTVSWDALGLGEAEAPLMIEPLVQDSGAEIGYRVHMPYLEIKFSYYRSQQNQMSPFIARIEDVLKKHTVSRNGEDILNPLISVLSKASHLFVRDEVSQGLLFSRLQSIRNSDFTFTTDRNLPSPDGSWQILCRFMNESEFSLELLSPEKKALKQVIKNPYPGVPQMSERRRLHFTEMVLIAAVQHWRD